jgi:hypothetical protein
VPLYKKALLKIERQNSIAGKRFTDFWVTRKTHQKAQLKLLTIELMLPEFQLLMYSFTCNSNELQVLSQVLSVRTSQTDVVQLGSVKITYHQTR